MVEWTDAVAGWAAAEPKLEPGSVSDSTTNLLTDDDYMRSMRDTNPVWYSKTFSNIALCRSKAGSTAELELSSEGYTIVISLVRVNLT